MRSYSKSQNEMGGHKLEMETKRVSARLGIEIICVQESGMVALEILRSSDCHEVRRSFVSMSESRFKLERVTAEHHG